MTLKATLATALLLTAPYVCSTAHAQNVNVRPAPPAGNPGPPPAVVRPGPPVAAHPGGPMGHPGGPGGHVGGPGGRPGGGAVYVAPPRPAPPQWQPHPGGGHPHGPIVRQHGVRVLAPRVIVRGNHQWRHWEHPEFSRPAYYWNWSAIRSVTCIAEDSYGDQYPVTETVGAGFGLPNMSYVEDEALDRCNDESGGDAACYLATCTHY